MMRNIVIPAIVVAVAGVVSALLLVPLLARLGKRWGLLDYPGGRKRHGRPVPLIGGIAVVAAGFIAVAISTLLWPHGCGVSGWFLLGVACMLAVGVADDWLGMSHLAKAALQLVIIVPLIVFVHGSLTDLGSLFGGGVITLGYLAVPFTILCLLGYINAENMIDGLDGLAAGVALISLVFLAVFAKMQGASDLFLDTVAIGGATAGFLAYNLRTPWRKHAVVFLGDAGSMVLGLMVGWCALKILADGGAHEVSPLSIAWVLALPVMDTLVVIARRLLLGRSPFQADRLHLHHLLTDLGVSSGHSTWLLLGLSFLYGMCGLMGYVVGAPDWVLFAAFIGVLALHTAFVFLAHRHAASAAARGLQPDAAVQ